jgi:hypothetical protein
MTTTKTKATKTFFKDARVIVLLSIYFKINPKDLRTHTMSYVIHAPSHFCKVLLNKDHATCGKERFIGTRPQGCPPDEGAAAWLKWVVCFIGGAEPWGRERVSGLNYL